jgi:nitric oxide reductase subunit B
VVVGNSPYGLKLLGKYLLAVIGWALIKIIGANRQIVEMWLWIEVAMLFGSGILGIGHHYFWIGTPEYWWEIGALFSALEPVPLVAMFVHVMYDWGKEKGIHQEVIWWKSSNE